MPPSQYLSLNIRLAYIYTKLSPVPRPGINCQNYNPSADFLNLFLGRDTCYTQRRNKLRIRLLNR